MRLFRTKAITKLNNKKISEYYYFIIYATLTLTNYFYYLINIHQSSTWLQKFPIIRPVYTKQYMYFDADIPDKRISSLIINIKNINNSGWSYLVVQKDSTNVIITSKSNFDSFIHTYTHAERAKIARNS